MYLFYLNANCLENIFTQGSFLGILKDIWQMHDMKSYIRLTVTNQSE